jgi:23S rRNA pseudouridine2605 synthase
MRINKFIASASALSRRGADAAIASGRVRLNNRSATTGDQITPHDQVYLDNHLLKPAALQTIMLNKPVGYVVSHDGQGSRTIYDLLPAEHQQLQPVGRLDKDSSGLLLLTNDGDLANELTHPRYVKTKLYEITLDTALAPLHHQMIVGPGIALGDGVSSFQLDRLKEGDDSAWLVTMHEGRNRQIRRTFEVLGYTVKRLHRIQFGTHQLGGLATGTFKTITHE